MGIIYKAINKINGKAYIGFDSSWPNRKLCHLHNSKKITDQSFYFHRAINKHGPENFIWEVIKENATLDDEIELIEEHNTFWTTGTGYNLTKGGDGNLGWVMPDGTKEKISKKAMGNKKCLGRKLSEETKNKIRNSLLGKPSSTKGKPSPLRGRKQPQDLVEKRIKARLETLNKRKQGF